MNDKCKQVEMKHGTRFGKKNTHVVQEEAAHPAHERAIDSGSGTTEESERVVAEVGHRRVGVVKVGEHDDPVVREDIGDQVELDECRERGVVRPDQQESSP